MRSKGTNRSLFNTNYDPESINELLIRSAYCVFYCEDYEGDGWYYDNTLCDNGDDRVCIYQTNVSYGWEYFVPMCYIETVSGKDYLYCYDYVY